MQTEALDGFVGGEELFGVGEVPDLTPETVENGGGGEVDVDLGGVLEEGFGAGGGGGEGGGRWWCGGGGEEEITPFWGALCEPEVARCGKRELEFGKAHQGGLLKTDGGVVVVHEEM